MSDNFVGALAVFCIFGLPIAGWIAVRFFRFVERMEMIKRGIIPPPDINISRRAYREWVRSGGVGPMPGTGQQAQPFPQPPPYVQQPYTAQQPFTAQQQVPYARGTFGAPDDDAQRALYKGIRLALIGFALLIGLSFLGGTPGYADFHGGPWLLGGLIPMFVGIAQVIVALISGAQLPGQRATFGAPPPGPPPVQPPPPAPPSGAWEQPRSVRFEELSRPVKPPDIR